MGMYDTLNVPCPHCGYINSLQSKAGPCGLYDYTIDDAPYVVVQDLANERQYCLECSKEFSVRSRTVTRDEAYIVKIEKPYRDFRVQRWNDGTLSLHESDGEPIELDENEALRVVEILLSALRETRHIPPM